MRRALIRWLLSAGLVIVTFGVALVPMTTSAAPTPCVDLQIYSISFTPATPIVGHPATISIGIYNDGPCTVYPAFTVQWKESAYSPTGPSTQVPGGMLPYSTTTVTLPYVFTKAGNYQSQVSVDTTNAVAETNEVNNLQIAPVTVLPATVQLVIQHFTVSPLNYVPGTIPNPVAGRPSVAAITVYNQGNTASMPYRVDWTTRIGGTKISQQEPSLGAGATTTIYLDYTYLMPDSFTSVATIGFAVATTQVTVDPALPDLVIPQPLGGPPNPTFNPNPPIAGTPDTVSVTIANIGHADAGSFIVSWTPAPGVQPLTQQVNSLAEGATTTITFDYTFQFGVTYDSTFTVNSTRSVREMNYDNDSVRVQVPVGKATVDLTITSMYVVPTPYNPNFLPNPNQPTQGAPATFYVTIANQGNSPAGNFVVSLNPDTTGLMVPAPSTLTSQVNGLGAGQSETLAFPFTYTAFGNFRVLADVDAFNQVVETNEANNEMIIYPEVNPAPIDLRITNISFNPGSVAWLHTTTATVTVQNFAPVGDPWIAGTFAVQLFNPSSSTYGSVQWVPGLQPGQSATVTFNNVFASTFPGMPSLTDHNPSTSQQVKVVVNPYNTVQEPCAGCSTNNTNYASFTVTLK